MNEGDLRDALLRGEHPIDVPALTAHVLRRDRRRIWLLGTFCVIAWMLVVMLPWSTVLPMMARVVQQLARGEDRPTTPSHDDMVELLRVIKTGTIATFIGSIASMFMAAVSTVSLIIFSRRATLRQVNARLAEILDQLKTMSK